jgi:Domain of unknown function (DUF6265)
MNKICLTLACVSIMISAMSQHSPLPDLNKLNWIQGTWTCSNPKPGRTLQEHWNKVSDEELRGYSLSMKGADTLSFEKMHILMKDNELFFVADVPENKKLIYFRITEINDSGFVCQNPDHDFPKQISYSVNGNKLKATISGNGKSIDYLFEQNK